MSLIISTGVLPWKSLSFTSRLAVASASSAFADALTAVGQEVEVHFFAKGGHGFGPGRSEDGTAQWLGLLADWIKRR